MAKDNQWKKRWLNLFSNIENRLEMIGLQEFSGVLSDIADPLLPALSQILWLTQPGLAIFNQGEAVKSLAELLENPAEMHHPSEEQE